MKKRKKPLPFTLFKFPPKKEKVKRFNYALHVTTEDTKYFETKEQAEDAVKNLSSEFRKVSKYRIKKMT